MARLTRRTWCLIRALPAMTLDAGALEPALQRRRAVDRFGQARFQRFGAAAEPVDPADQGDGAAAQPRQAVAEVAGGVVEAGGAGGEFLAAGLDFVEPFGEPAGAVGELLQVDQASTAARR